MTNQTDEKTLKVTDLKTLVDCANNGDDYTDFTALDDFTGRASSFMYVLLGVKHVHANKMAKLAVQILDRAEITYSYDTMVDAIAESDSEILFGAEQAVLRSGSAVQALKDLNTYFSNL